MHAVRDIIVLVLLIGGYFFLAAGVIGLIRLLTFITGFMPWENVILWAPAWFF